MSQDHQAPQAQENRLVDPNVPADQGLSTLGLLMQLAGSIFAGYGTIVLFMMLMMPGGRGNEKGMMILIAAASVARSAFHRLAGGDLLYRRQTLDGQASPLAGIKRYVLVALGHTLLLGLIFKFKLKLDGKIVFAICAGLALWPAVLGGLMQLPRFRRFQTELPVPEDKGFEGASVLMTVLGAIGTLFSGAGLYVMVAEMDGLLQHGVGILILVAVVMLFIRSIFHVQAGLSGLRETNLDRSVELANRYANFGVIASFCAAGAVLLVFMMGRPHPVFIAFVAGICWLLLAWPLIIRRFFSDRQFVDLMAGEGASLHRRAPDSGLTGLGWLLFGMAMFSASLTLPQVIIGNTPGGSNELTDMMFMMAPAGLRSIWWSVGLVALQAWAGYELIRMSPHSRMIGTVFAAGAVLMALYVNWPMLKALSHFINQPKMIVAFIPIAIQLVVPIATLVLVNRKITPAATARYKPSGAPQG